jgi:hypothetical protein
MHTNKIYVDTGRPATLQYGQRSVHCFTLQEAKLAWNRLPPEQRKTATIKVADGTLYQESGACITVRKPTNHDAIPPVMDASPQGMLSARPIVAWPAS